MLPNMSKMNSKQCLTCSIWLENGYMKWPKYKLKERILVGACLDLKAKRMEWPIGGEEVVQVKYLWDLINFYMNFNFSIIISIAIKS